MELWDELKNTNGEYIKYSRKAMEYDSRCEVLEDELIEYVREELSTIKGIEKNVNWNLGTYVETIRILLSSNIIHVIFINSFYMKGYIFEELIKLFSEFDLSIHSVDAHLLLVMEHR